MFPSYNILGFIFERQDINIYRHLICRKDAEDLHRRQEHEDVEENKIEDIQAM